MRRIYFALILYIAVLPLLGCKTVITYIENVADYEIFEIIVPNNSIIVSGDSGLRLQTEVHDKNFKNKKLIMNDYYIVENEKISNISNLKKLSGYIEYDSTVGGRYEFYKGEICLYNFNIVTEAVGVNQSRSTTAVNFAEGITFIRIFNDDNTVQVEITPNLPPNEIYFSIYDSDIGNFIIKRYKSRSANESPNSPWQYHTGFIIEIDNEEFGILAFYPNPKFYKKKSFNRNINENIMDKIILYFFIAYEEMFNRKDDVFIGSNEVEYY